MFGSVRWRLIWIAILVALCGWALVPKENARGETVPALKRGLDLQGGMHLTVEIDDPDSTLAGPELDDALERTLTTVRNRIDQFGVEEPNIQRVGDRISVELAGLDDPDRAEALVTTTAFMEFKIITDGSSFIDVLDRMDRAIVAEVGAENLGSTTLEAEPETDLGDLLGAGAEVDSVTAVPDSAATNGEPDGAATDTAGDAASDPAPGAASDVQALRPLTASLFPGNTPGEYLVQRENQETVAGWLELDSVQELIPRDVTLHWGVEEMGAGGNTYLPLYVLEADPLITGDLLEDAGPATRDPTFNQPIVPFQTTRRGARVFERGTSRNVGNNMAIVLDERVQSYAVIQQILSRRAQITLTPGTPFQEAQDLALVLRAGALPQPIRVVERRSVGASLGEDSVRQGTIAFVIGIGAVIVLMIGYYRLAGVLAVGALAVYVVLMLGGLAGLQATLTLPGIAGLILSIGMAVDANVLIFERIREELSGGKTPRTAVESGFDNALSAIVDANLTTLITGVILFQFGTGAVRGFAVTLCIGILASFFSAIYVTRTFFMVYLNRRGANESVSI
ncbi:MAG: protein translocase subunit SecD [Gemmatimonadetes bacterium]|nr:protein translocase subunit SecD [Gemmatimonadota bacterium]